MMTLPSISLSVLALACTLPAQTKTAIYPLDHATREGYSHNSTYHLTAGICKFQHSYEDWNLDLPKGAKIHAFGYRQDGSYALSTLKIELEAFMGHNTKPAEKLGYVYASNYDSTPTQVIAKKSHDLPGFARGSSPSKNFVLLKLDAPFTYQAGKNLVTEVLVHSNNKGNKSFNYYLDYAQYYAPWTTIGTGCKGSAGQVPRLTLGPAVLGGQWRLDLQKFPASAGTLLILGASKTKLLGILNLPFRLDVLRMKDCYQYVDMNFLMTGPTTNSSGSAYRNLLLPLDTKLVGQQIFVQLWALDLAANPAGLITSNGAEGQFGMYPRVHLLYTLGNVKDISGQRKPNHGQVTRFDYQ